MIGSYNNSGVIFGVWPAILESGSAVSSFYTGTMPMYSGAKATALVTGYFVDMVSGYGGMYNDYIINSHTSGSGYLLTNYYLPWVSGSSYTIEANFIHYSGSYDGSTIKELIGQDDGTSYWYAGVSGNNPIFAWALPTTTGQVIASGDLSNSTNYNIFWEITGGAVNIYVDGSGEIGTYLSNDTYNQADNQITGAAMIILDGDTTPSGTWDARTHRITLYSGTVSSANKEWNATYYDYNGLEGIDEGDGTMSVYAQVAQTSLSTPASGAVEQFNPTLSWNSVSDASYYQIQLSRNSDMSSPIVNSSGISATSYSTSSLVFGETYYWRVRAYNPADTGAWSSIASFYTRGPGVVVPPGSRTAYGRLQRAYYRGQLRVRIPNKLR